MILMFSKYVYPPHKSKTEFCPHKMLAIFQIKSPITLL